MSHRPYSIGIPEQDPAAVTNDHAVLQNVTSDQHHAKSHTHSGADGSGVVSYPSLTNLPTTSVEHSNTSHVTAGFPESSRPGDTTQQGSSSSVARLDHQHAREAFGLPVPSFPGSNNSAGSASTVARSDHKHGREGQHAIFLPGEPGEDGLDVFPGPAGERGIQGIQGLMGFPGLDADPPDEPLVLPGVSGGLIFDHAAASDPHAGYRLESADHTHATTGLQAGTVAHSALTGLTTGDDHTQYALLAGRSGGQILTGGTAASESLTLQSTANATRGNVSVLDGKLQLKNPALVEYGATEVGFLWHTSGPLLFYLGVNNFIFKSNGLDKILIYGSAAGTPGINLLDGILYGSLFAGNTLTLTSTTHATKGKILFGTSAYDELNNRLGIGTTGPTAALHIKAGTTAANTSPLKLTSGALLTTAEAGAIEFLTDAFYGTITTGAARKTFAFLESPTFTGTVTIPTLISTTVIRLRSSTVAALPAGTQGDKMFVTDALTPTYLTTVVGGGAIVTEVFYNGTTWVCT